MLGKYVGHKAFCGRENYAQKYQVSSVHTVGTPVNWRKDSKKDDYSINEEGMIKVLVGSQQPLAKGLAEYMGVKLIGHKYVCKEADTIYTIQKVFEGISMKRQFSIGSYRIDLYFPEHKLAIDCDEHNLRDKTAKVY